MNTYPDDPNAEREGYENLSELPGERLDPLEEPFSSKGRFAPVGDSSIAEEDARELPPEETASDLRASDQELTVEDENAL